jgi:hypothetical protein
MKEVLMETKKLNLFPVTDKQQKETTSNQKANSLKVKSNIKAGPVEAVEVCG